MPLPAPGVWDDNPQVATQYRVMDVFLGALLGGVVGAIVAVNFIITLGIGYDVTLGAVFRENVLAGLATVGILVAGPIVGAVWMRRMRRRQGGQHGRPSQRR